jgi:4-amino-4-deoxy-L-arabinose transferase-like glycosyltransferase
MSPSSAAKAPRRSSLVLALVFVCALAVRLWGISGVLPYVHHPDEITNEEVAVLVAHAPFRSPGFFNYPSLLFYAQAFVIRVDEAVRSSQVSKSELESQGNAKVTEVSHWVLGRGLTALVSATTATLSAVLALSLGASLTVALVAGLSVAVSPLAVENARYLTPDSYAALFCSCALVLAMRVARRRQWRDYLLAGLFVGLAAGSKYNVVLVAIAVVVAHCLRERRVGVFFPHLLAGGEVAAVAFLATTPFALFDFPSLLAALEFESHHYLTGHGGSDGNSPAFHAATLWNACGLWLPLAFTAPLLPNAESRRGAIAVLVFSVSYYAFLSSFTVHFDRNLVPLVSPVVVLGVVGFAGLLERGRARVAGSLHAWLPQVALLASFAVMFAVHAARVVAATRASLVNQRAPAERFASEHLRVNGRVLVESYGPWVDYMRFSVQGFSNIMALSGVDLKDADYLVLAEESFGRYMAQRWRFPIQAARYDFVFRTYCEIGRFALTPGQAIHFFDLNCNRGVGPFPALVEGAWSQ